MKKKKKKWIPRIGGKFYSVKVNGTSVDVQQERRDGHLPEQYEWNCFKTQEEASQKAIEIANILDP
jgi:hypothetical protein